MADHKLAVTRAKNFPFLTLEKILEGQGRTPDTTMVLTGDELEDYEDVVKRFAQWQERLADADSA